MDLLDSDARTYRVLARTYRPNTLAELIGQETLVRALTNALASGRIAHAFLLTGIRGVGKTTTARIIARSLNCTGADGKGGPTAEPCGACSSCRAITGESSMDVIEMDAATRTGIDDIREIVDAVRYAPAASRYKIYIIDEVHMLSEKAFNGLLKTLEEPPPHAKFVFATTEARKVPVTVLSRCQRFDLRRVDPDRLEAHLASICKREEVAAESEALALIARTAEGSVRDSLSLLDQAIALGDRGVRAEHVAGMLGLGDRGRILDLFESLTAGDAGRAIDLFRELYDRGAEPSAVIHDLLETTHWLSALRVARDRGSIMSTDAALGERGKALAEGLSLAVLARVWQILLKGLEEVRNAPDAGAAAEMIFLRLACIGDLPTPGEMIRRLREQDTQASAASSPPARRAPMPEHAVATVPTVVSRSDEPLLPDRFEALVAMLQDKGERPLAAFLSQGARLIDYAPPRLELQLDEGLPGDLSTRLKEALRRLTGRNWELVLRRGNEGAGGQTLVEQAQDERARLMTETAATPAVREVLEAFPGAELVDARRRNG